MALRDIKSMISPALSIVPAARSSSANGSSVDLQGYGSAAVVVVYGDWTDGTHTPSLEKSSDGTNFTACDSAELSGSFTALSSVGGENTVQKVGYVGSARYLRVVLTVAGASTGAVTAALIVRGTPVQA